MKHKALWFSKDKPTMAQLEEIDIAFELVNVGYGCLIGNIRIVDDNSLVVVHETLVSMARDNNATAVFGVFPVPLQEVLVLDAESDLKPNMEDDGLEYTKPVRCYTSWDVDKYTVQPEFRRYCYVGVLSDPSPTIGDVKK